MNSKNIKVVDEHNIDRNADVMFAFELEGSGYVSYSIERDEENSNVFVSKVLRNLDSTFNMIDIDDSAEKSRLVEILKKIITIAVESQSDKLSGSSLTLADGKVVKFINVSFNKEQRINVQKTYITTVKKEVVRVVEKYYVLEAIVEQPKVVEEIFPTITPVVPTVTPVEEVLPEIPSSVVAESPVLSMPTLEIAQAKVDDSFVAFGSQPVAEVKIEGPVVSVQQSAPVLEQVKESVPEVILPVESTVPVSTQTIIEPITVPEPTPTPTSTVVEPVVVPVEPVAQPLVFDATKETNLNAALGEVANSATIPVENIEPVREFGVEEPVVQSVLPEQPTVIQSEVLPTNVVTPSTNEGGFANSKFFMVVAIAFFLASCIFLGYEVFNYFQLTK